MLATGTEVGSELLCRAHHVWSVGSDGEMVWKWY